MTVLLMLLVQPMVGAALSRMPYPLESLAMWPVVFGLLTIWQSVGLSYNEAVIALLEEPQPVPVFAAVYPVPGRDNDHFVVCDDRDPTFGLLVQPGSRS
jgi:hypothetical protein